MKIIPVKLKERSYDIVVGPLGDAFTRRLKSLGVSSQASVLVVTSQAVARAGHLKTLLSLLRKNGCQATTQVLPNGEQIKSFSTLASLYRKGFAAKLDRKSLVLALGGGTITDLAGYMAATYMRGVPFVAVPTTLLGMVDAAIGGKTGIDVPEGKNLVGAFWQPKLVWIDARFLRTLPMREWATGFAEVVKYGVIKDRAFFDWLERKVAAQPRVSAWPPAAIEHAVHVSAGIKARVVAADEKETPLKGGREILNFGHTIGHALEATLAYRGLTHGEAISIGMVAAGLIALCRGHWNKTDQLRLMTLLTNLNLPIRCPALSKSQLARFTAALLKDKKNVQGHLRFVLPKQMGRVVVEKGIPMSLVTETIGTLREDA